MLPFRLNLVLKGGGGWVCYVTLVLPGSLDKFIHRSVSEPLLQMKQLSSELRPIRIWGKALVYGPLSRLEGGESERRALNLRPGITKRELLWFSISPSEKDAMRTPTGTHLLSHCGRLKVTLSMPNARYGQSGIHLLMGGGEEREREKSDIFKNLHQKLWYFKVMKKGKHQQSCL